MTVYYKKLETLLKNQHQEYDSVETAQLFKEKYMGQMYPYDLTKDKQLKAVVTHFINNLQHPSNLVDVTEPSFTKKILAVKRELIMQGVKFPTLADQKKLTKELSKIERNIKKGKN